MQSYIRFWILCCVAFVINIGLLSCFSALIKPVILHLLVNGVNLYIALFLYCACCVIDNIPYLKSFVSYTPLLIVLVIVIYLCGFDPFIIFFCYISYQIILTFAIVFTVIWKWTRPRTVKLSASACFITCGAFFLYCNSPSISPAPTGFLMTVILLLLNFLFTWLYQEKTSQNKAIQQERIQTLAERVPDILFHYTLAPYPCFSYISMSVETITGYTPDLFYEDPKLHLSLSHEEDREVFAAAFSPDISSFRQRGDVRWQKKDGEYLYLEFHSNPVFSEGKMTAITGILRDITERKMAEQELINSKAERQILLSYISHELRTPITYILGYAEALQKDHFESEEKKRNAIELVWAKAVFLQKLMEDLFQLAKMETNQFSFEFMQTKVLDLFHILDEQYHKEFKNQNISFESHMDEQLKSDQYEVLVDVKRIEQVAFNLLHNAVNYSEDNGKITCKCFLDKKKQRIAFQVSNTGKSIPKEEQVLIFKQFYKGTHVGKNIRGSGLGLSLSRLIIQAHKGDISVRSEKGSGTTFQFTIPLYTEKV